MTTFIKIVTVKAILMPWKKENQMNDNLYYHTINGRANLSVFNFLTDRNN